MATSKTTQGDGSVVSNASIQYKEEPSLCAAGIYEQVVNRDFAEKLSHIADQFKEVAAIDQEEAAGILTAYLRRIIDQGLSIAAEQADKEERLATQIALANQIIQLIQQHTQNDSLAGELVASPGEQLLSLLPEKNNMRAVSAKAEIPRPETSLIETSLFTGAKSEPSMFNELKKEILSSDRIDMLVSFIKWSGLRLLYEEFQTFAKRGGRLRLIATSYMGATDVKAIDALAQLPGVEIRMSYDTKRTRLHAKAYLFYRNTEYHTAYIGSSNLSHAAISSGLEWNVKITAYDSPATMRKVMATFESYWNAPEFENYTMAQHEYLEAAIRRERYHEQVAETPGAYCFTITPYGYQRRILDQLTAERTLRHNFHNLIVAATGTGKTVIAAFDYRRFCREHPGQANRLLFIAHREEILTQSQACFQGILQDPNFGDLFVGHHRPEQMDHLFLSIQTFNSQDWSRKTSADFYDYIIVDEFHHAAADSYQRMLSYYQPKILLGLTATPERMDGKDILQYFGGHPTAELRLPEAIERSMLCPFHYFGVTDTVDLRSLRWESGGYAKSELTNVYALQTKTAQKRADLILQSIERYVTDASRIHGVGFCVSVKHAEFMADYFNQKGIPSRCLTGASADELREQAKRDLAEGRIRFIFVVDLYNEGVDIPEIDTILFLRPTESLTIFLQQLGRGLRLAEGKECLTVLDFIGQANKKYRFEEKFNALLSNTSRSVASEIQHGFTAVPHGCYVQLEKKARDYILENIRAALNNRQGLLQKIKDFAADNGQDLTLANFLRYYRLDIRQLYRKNNKESFARLCVEAGVREDFQEPDEDKLTKACKRIVAIDSRRWLQFLIEWLPRLDELSQHTFSSLEYRMLQMFHFTIWQDSVEKSDFTDLMESLQELNRNPVLLQEIQAVLAYQQEQLDFIDHGCDLGFDCPLDVHCHYTRDQIFSAMDYYKTNTIRQGVFHLPEKKLDVFMITLNKSEKHYSPSTMYNDYSINESLFHWQSQSTTSDTSPTAQRYFHHRENGDRILLFVREYGDDTCGKAPYLFLGTANYVRHNGSRPVSIIWRLDDPIPAKFLTATNKLVAE